MSQVGGRVGEAVHLGPPTHAPPHLRPGAQRRTCPCRRPRTRPPCCRRVPDFCPTGVPEWLPLLAQLMVAIQTQLIFQIWAQPMFDSIESYMKGGWPCF